MPTSSSTITLIVLLPVLASILIYQLHPFDPAPFPLQELTQPPLEAPLKNSHMLKGSELIGKEQLKGPEDIVYDKELGIIYVSCEDGWIKRVSVKESVDDMVVENWVNTGGRPLGLALGLGGEVIVADAYEGLLNISKNGDIQLLSIEESGRRFALTDGVAVADDGNIYFTDASSKYNLSAHIIDILDAKPNGRLLKYDPVTKKTTLLADKLYFANGVAVSPDQDYVIFCESPMLRCRKYYIRGEKKETIEKFIDNLPGLPDNIHYADGHYWIGFPTENTALWTAMMKYPAIRKVAIILSQAIGTVDIAKNSGVFAVDLEGNPKFHYYDSRLQSITSGVRIGNYLYCGSLQYSHIIRLNLDKNFVV